MDGSGAAEPVDAVAGRWLDLLRGAQEGEKGLGEAEQSQEPGWVDRCHQVLSPVGLACILSALAARAAWARFQRATMQPYTSYSVRPTLTLSTLINPARHPSSPPLYLHPLHRCHRAAAYPLLVGAMCSWLHRLHAAQFEPSSPALLVQARLHPTMLCSVATDV